MNSDEDKFFAEIENQKRQLDSIQIDLDQAISNYRASVQADEAANRGASDATRKLNGRVVELSGAFRRAVEALQAYVGVPDEAFEAIATAKRPVREERYWHRDIEETPVTGDIDVLAQAGLEQLMSHVDSDWLDSERRKRFRLEEDLVNEPLQLIGSVRVGGGEERSQRFARMLLVTTDHLKKHDRLDFFEAPMLVMEVAALGTRIDDIGSLGSAGLDKFRQFSNMNDAEVASTVYELVVGSAARRKGLNVEMLPPAKTRKTPDFRIHDLAGPASIECKRRLGVLNYELQEAAHIGDLYEAIRPDLRRAHARVDVTFTDEVRSVDGAAFLKVALPLITGAWKPQRGGRIAGKFHLARA